MKQPVVFDLTIYEADGETPMYGSAYEGALEESDFQTRDPELEHPRPYLSMPFNGIGTEINFIEGSSVIGTQQMKVLDKRTNPADKSSGMLTARVPDMPGKRAVWRRWIDGEWRVRLDGVVVSVTVDPDDLVSYIFEIQDGRRFEKDQSLFFSNFVLYGKDGATGPAEDYGVLASGEPMLRAVEPYESISDGPIDHFIRLSEATPADGVHWGLVAGPYDFGDVFGLSDLGWFVFGDDGLLYFREHQVWWRAKGSDDPWTVLRNMPSSTNSAGANRPGTGINLGDGSVFFPHGSSLYLGSFNEADIPTTGQEIELLVVAVRITEKTPFWWSRGTVGDLLTEIAAGLHTTEPPRERYDPVALAAFAASSPPASLILDAPVQDRRRWHEENIYKAALAAPTYGPNRELAPRTWEIPSTADAIPILHDAQPIGEWQLPIGEAIREVEYTYVREHLDPRKTIQVKDKAPWYYFGFGEDRTLTMPDPADTRRDWQRLVQTPVRVTNTNEDAPPGGKRLVYAPVTIRSVGDVDGAPVGGDTQDELGQQMADKTFETVLFHNRLPRPRIVVEAAATVANLAILPGDFLRARLPWLPDITERVRNMRQVVRVTAVTESEDPSKVILTLQYTGVADNTADDDEVGTGTGGEDCLTGGTRLPAGNGRIVRTWRTPGRFTVENTCNHPVVCGMVVVARGGDGGTTGGGGGGGGGTGGVLGGDGELEVTIPANSMVTIDVDASGDSIVWIHKVTGAVMDPDVDDPDDAYRAIRGGGDGDNGGSGGGASAEMPISGGATHGGGNGTAGQGNDGGDGVDAGGIATCQRSAGGGGGSYAGAGTAGVIPGGPLATPPIAGEGGPSSIVPGWGIRLGGGGQGGTNTEPQGGGEGTCGAAVARPGANGASGWGYGGGGGADGSGAGTGGRGGVALRYAASLVPNLQPPTISSIDVDEQGRARVCIDGDDWPAGVPTNYAVRIEYAIGDYEPDPSSSDWRFLDMLEAPGCVVSPPVPTGAKVWARGRAQADSFKFSGYSAGVDGDAAATPGFAWVELFVQSDGTATLAWVALPTTGAVRIRRKIHLPGESVTRPLTLVASLDDAATPYVFEDPVPEGSIITVDLEAWEDNTYTVQGRIERRAENNPERRFVERSDGLDALSDVVLSNPQPGDLLELDEYDIWVNKPRQVVLAETAQQLSNDPTEFLNGEGDFAPLPNLSGWNEVVATTDEDVTNSSTLQDDDQLTFAVGSGETYHVELLLTFSGSDNAVDMKTKLTFPSSDGFWRSEGKGTSGLAVDTFSVFGPTATATPVEVAFGTESSHALCVAHFYGMISTKASGNVVFQFANNSAALGRVTRRKAGSVLRYRRLV